MHVSGDHWKESRATEARGILGYYSSRMERIKPHKEKRRPGMRIPATRSRYGMSANFEAKNERDRKQRAEKKNKKHSQNTIARTYQATGRLASD
jgi:hypothetical protein